MRRTHLSPASLALAPLLALALASCSTATSQSGSVMSSRQAAVNTGERALIYGHIKAPKPIQAVQLARMLSPRRPSARVLPNGDFYFDDIAPGEYALMRFKAGNEWYTLLTGDRENNRRFIVTAKPGGMHFVGSWRVTGEKHNRFTPDEFTIERTAEPGEKALLNRLRHALAGTGWERKVGGGHASGAKPAAPSSAGAAPKKKPKGNRGA